MTAYRVHTVKVGHLLLIVLHLARNGTYRKIFDLLSHGLYITYTANINVELIDPFVVSSTEKFVGILKMHRY